MNYSSIGRYLHRCYCVKASTYRQQGLESSPKRQYLDDGGELTEKTVDDGDTHFKCCHFGIVQETETERRTIKGRAR